MANKKQLSVNSALRPKRVCGVQQRGAAQGHRLLGKVVEDSWLSSLHGLRSGLVHFRIRNLRNVPEQSHVAERGPKQSWKASGTKSLVGSIPHLQIDG